MRIFYRFWSIFVIAIKRIMSQPGMALATVLGMIFAISLTMSVPLYASSVYNSIFLQRVGVNPEAGKEQPFPPFTFLYTYDTNVLGNLQWDDLLRVNSYLKESTEAALGLPVKTYARYVATNPLALFPSAIQQFPDDQKPLLWSSLAFMDDFEEHITIIEGSYPNPVLDENGVVEVLVTYTLATDLGLQVGEEYSLFARNQMINGSRGTVTIPVKISGVYQANNPEEDYWFIKSEMLKERLIVPEETFAKRISPALNDEIYGAFWFLLVDGSSVRYDQATNLVFRITNYHKQAAQLLPKIKLSVSPVEALMEFQRAANLLTILLFAFSVPIFGLLLAFIAMTAGMTVERQRNEIAVLRSRGAMVMQMVGIATVESLLLGLLALAIGLPVSAGIAMAISRTRSFLDFSNESQMLLNWSPTTIYFGLGAIALAILARLMPTFRAARDNIVIYKRERARNLRAPVWQRMWLDVLLLIPAGYGIYLLRQQGSIDALNASATGDPFTNPLLIMVPALAIFALSLLFLRLMPLLMHVITWISSRTRSVGLMMAARHLARTPTTYTLPLVLLILTLSLSAFTATLAGTLDNHLHDQVYYNIGADVYFMDIGDSPDDPNSSGFAQPEPTPAAPSSGFSLDIEDPNPPGWYFLPVTEYLSLPGVKDATRIGRFRASAILGTSTQSGNLIGIDRHNLPNVAFWRPDFASVSLGELMNRLAVQPDGILVNEEFQREHALNNGDLITLRISNNSTTSEVDFYLVGTFKLFPTYYPNGQPLFVANLNTIFDGLGGEYPYDVWLKTDPGEVNVDDLNYRASFDIGARTIAWREPISVINGEQSRPERQGLFGVLSVGFGAAALLTVLGFLLYALLSYQRRFVELGVLRAIGLSAGQMTIFLAAELAFLILMGGLVGTSLGVWISNMFIPYLQVGTSVESQIPPYVVYVAWPAILRVYALFGALFIVALTTLMVMLRRMKIFAAIKMGETV